MWIVDFKIMVCAYYFCTAIVGTYHHQHHHNSAKQQQELVAWRDERFYRPAAARHRDGVSSVQVTTESAAAMKNSAVNYYVKDNSVKFPNINRVNARLDNMLIGGRNQKTTVSPYPMVRIRHNGRNSIRSGGTVGTTTTTTTTTTPSSTDGLFDDDYYYSDDTNNDDVDGYYLDYEDDDDGGYPNTESLFHGGDDDDVDTTKYHHQTVQSRKSSMNHQEKDEEYPRIASLFRDDDTKKYQAEQPKQPSSSAGVQQSLSPITIHKWNHYGSKDSVAASRDEFMQQAQQQQTVNPSVMAAEHYQRVVKLMECSKPVPKVISVRTVDQDSNKSYAPECTILHRCAEDTGCCADSAVCSPTNQEDVKLYFFVTIGLNHSEIVALLFKNHTACGCKDKLEISATLPIVEENSPYQSDISSSSSVEMTTASDNMRRCKCPKEFTPDRAKCICKCKDSNSACVGRKRGEEHFSLTDRKCILKKECRIPVCEYGDYDEGKGRCPPKEEYR